MNEPASGQFPTTRLRRLRHHPAVRAMVRETHLAPENLILPLFVRADIDTPQPIKSMPGVFQLSLEAVKQEAREAADLGLGAVILFGIPETKDDTGSSALDPNGVVQNAIKEIK